MNEHILTKEQQTEVLDALNKAANNEVWGKSTILRVIGKQVSSVRDDFENLINPSKNVNPVTTHTATGTENERVSVYVAVYCTKGTDMKNWERVLATLPAQLISRPIYPDEKYAITLIKSKTNKENEAYLCLDIPTNTIVQPDQDKPMLDKLGNPLMTLKGKPMSAQYEATFFHQSGKYQYSNGKLIKLNPPYSS
jgi:intracellular multiplication protein IcmQ